MAAILSAVFRGVDEMSNILDSMAKSGEDFVAQLGMAGSGAIDISGPYDEERMTGLLFANLKPALLGILKQEMFEEGDLSYEF